MKRYHNPRGTFVFVSISVALMLTATAVQSVLQKNNPPAGMKPTITIEKPNPKKEPLNYQKVIDPREPKPFLYEDLKTVEPVPESIPEYKEPETKPPPAPADKTTLTKPPYKIAIIIDDMGMDRKRSRAMVDLDPRLTLAFLPYAPDLGGITQDAKAQGHELMIHMPMQPTNPDLDIGSIGLRENMSEEEWGEQLDKAFAAFDGYAGLNNHMGSQLTQNPRAMQFVMEKLKDRGLFFIDSKTIAASVAADIAKESGAKMASRDVFLDHENTIGFVRGALAKTEKLALKNGFAIAIGHPKDATIEGLREWLPTLAAKQIEIVPASTLTHSYAVANAGESQEVKPPENPTLEQSPEREKEEIIFSDPLPETSQSIAPLPEPMPGLY
ncbi:MAG: divergent polysaccharide deacetylase family protein [Alphaproteobacteria bacterium]|nr:divergent polysaccharide deacetylase family protein [Alphaproteobacteria bacterium]